VSSIGGSLRLESPVAVPIPAGLSSGLWCSVHPSDSSSLNLLQEQCEDDLGGLKSEATASASKLHTAGTN